MLCITCGKTATGMIEITSDSGRVYTAGMCDPCFEDSVERITETNPEVVIER